MKKITLVIFTLVTLQLFGQAPNSVRKPAGAARTMRPKLVLAIIADQFRYDYLLRFKDEYKGGLKQLWDKGAVFQNARLDHFPTVTSVGHAAFLTGAYPSVNGIVGNQWYDRSVGKVIPSAADSSVKMIGGSGGSGSSPRNLLVSTVGDEMKIADKGRSKVFGISIKDYSGILATGRMANAVFWFENSTGNFVTSTYYAQDLPDWAKSFNAKRLADRYQGMEWLGTRLAGEPGPKLYGMLASTPFGNELIEGLAEAAIVSEQLGRDSYTDLLMLSFSSNDYVGHRYGPDSEQVREVSLATDRLLGKLFRFLEAQVGMANVTVVFAADHGVAPMIEVNAARKMPGGRASFTAIRDAVQKALVEKYGDGNWISGMPEENIYLNWELISSKKLTREEVSREAAQAALTAPNVFRVYTREQLQNGYAMEDSIGRRVMHGYSSQRGADLNIVLEPYYQTISISASHGTPFGYDTHVPVIFMGPGIKPGKYRTSIVINDVAPTLANILDIEIPSGAEGRILSEIFTQP